MAHATAKVERNNKIKSLWEKGGITQEKIGRMFGLGQGRINAIIYNRLPSYRYCRYCNCRLKKIAVCEDCKQKNRLIKYKAKEERERQLNLLRAQKRVARELKQKDREILLQKAKEAMELKRRELEERTLVQIGIRVKREEINKQKLFPWQRRGRENTRFLVRLRDKFTCQDCGLIRTPQEVADYNKENGKGKMKSLDVHHLNGECGKKSKGYDSVKDLSNMITLCHKCHFNHPQHTLQK